MPAFTKEDFISLAEGCELSREELAINLGQELPPSVLATKCREAAANVGSVSDGYHTFDELYDHRITLFIALCFQIYTWSLVDRRSFEASTTRMPWRSKLHSDGSALEGWFVMGIGKAPGEQLTYHLPLDRWTETDFVTEIERAPEWDNHTSTDVIARLKKIYR